MKFGTNCYFIGYFPITLKLFVVKVVFEKDQWWFAYIELHTENYLFVGNKVTERWRWFHRKGYLIANVYTSKYILPVSTFNGSFQSFQSLNSVISNFQTIHHIFNKDWLAMGVNTPKLVAKFIRVCIITQTNCLLLETTVV